VSDSAEHRPWRVAILASHVIQYQAPFYQQLARDPRLDITVLYCSRAGLDAYRDEDMAATLAWDLPLLEGYESQFLRNFGSPHRDFLRHVNPAVITAIDRSRFDAVLFMLGWGSLTAWMAAVACRASQTPIFMYGDSSFVPSVHSLRGRVRELILRGLFSVTDAFLISGNWNADYYRHYGADEDRFFLMPWAIDNERFRSSADISAAERLAIRQRYGVPHDGVVFAFSGKLIPRKDPMVVIEALAIAKAADSAHIMFIGDGELREELQRRSHELSLSHRVHFTGFVNQAEIPRLYAASDSFVLPSHYDPRATVVNEAMAAGLPIIITDRCGPAGDLVRPGANGFVIAPGDAEALAFAINELTSKPALRASMSQASASALDSWGYEQGVDGVIAAAEAYARRR
jgi:glycosyltransferase involved in cell wall biosynthesis